MDLAHAPAGTVIVAQDFTPSMTVGISRENVVGIITEIGGRTSHSAILARALEIPAVLGVPGAAAVSYTHLDVYKRQGWKSWRPPLPPGRLPLWSGPASWRALRRSRFTPPVSCLRNFYSGWIPRSACVSHRCSCLSLIHI